MLEMEPAVGSGKPANQKKKGKRKKAGFHQKDPPWCDWFWRLGFNTAGSLRVLSAKKHAPASPLLYFA
jgi:hypothetical protein